jgi:Domain of unknown function (DUF5666)
MTNRLLIASTRALRGTLRTLAFALALAGCGGGVESGGTGSQTFASGTITGFGSVIVRGVRFDDSQATVTDADGTARSRDDLRLGMTTEIRGSALATDSSGTTVSTASSIAFGSDILGPIASIDTAAGRLVVLGQIVEINAVTVFDAASVGGGLSALSPGDLVEVYSLLDAATGRYTATRIERKTAAVTYVLRGIVSQLDTTAKAFNIGGERISYAAFGSALPATLANGSIVRVRLLTAQVAGAWVVSALSDGVQRPIDGDEVRLEGRVTAFVSATQFSVNGVQVDAGALNPAGVALGVRAEVEGTARGGVLVASKVEIKTDGEAEGQEFDLRGLVASPNPAALSFVLRGVTVVYSTTTTEFRKGSAAGLTTGASVEVRGTLSADGTRLLATRIEFK